MTHPRFAYIVKDLEKDFEERIAKIARREGWGKESRDEIERLRAENDLMRHALKPFAIAADALDLEKWDDECIDGSSAVVTGLHCRNARDALNLSRDS